MNSKLLVSALSAAILLASTSAFAQRNDHGNDRNDRGQQAQHDNGNRNDNNDRNYNNNRNDYNNRNDNKQRFANGHDNGNRGAGPRHDMRRGSRLSNDYRSNQYVVSDWRGHHLNAPPRGQHWVQAGNDYVLVAVATGIIAQVLLGN
jgi:Ni/Co efflux regulator RcnB